ncbi:MAG: Co2+/Mg2+ efflux protein ApaG [Pseudomonadota bacterium]
MYEATTSGIRVFVEPEFLEDQSTPDEGYYFWAYTVKITNETEASVRLKSRSWVITDADGRSENVRGPGVVGKMPRIQPGESFTYTSGCPLATPSGIMVGTYEMEDEDGAEFTVNVPAFSLDSKYTVRSVN